MLRLSVTMRAHALLVLAGILSASPSYASETTAYTYDVHGRVTNASRSGSVNNGIQTSYSHDAADNRSNVTVTGAPSSSAPQTMIVVPLGKFKLIAVNPSGF